MLYANWAHPNPAPGGSMDPPRNARSVRVLLLLLLATPGSLAGQLLSDDSVHTCGAAYGSPPRGSLTTQRGGVGGVSVLREK